MLRLSDLWAENREIFIRNRKYIFWYVEDRRSTRCRIASDFLFVDFLRLKFLPENSSTLWPRVKTKLCTSQILNRWQYGSQFIRYSRYAYQNIFDFGEKFSQPRKQTSEFQKRSSVETPVVRVQATWHTCTSYVERMETNKLSIVFTNRK